MNPIRACTYTYHTSSGAGADTESTYTTKEADGQVECSRVEHRASRAAPLTRGQVPKSGQTS